MAPRVSQTLSVSRSWFTGSVGSEPIRLVKLMEGPFQISMLPAGKVVKNHGITRANRVRRAR